jgi:hypothetical protein
MAQEDIVKMARKAGIAKYGLGWTCWEGQLEAFAALVAAAEREACAKVCEQAADDEFYMGRQYADAIRARGER